MYHSDDYDFERDLRLRYRVLMIETKIAALLFIGWLFLVVSGWKG